jgi:anaphase-promoting complex subunit 1
VQEHDITTLGLLLGLAASHRGTMDPAISKVLTSICWMCTYAVIKWV